MIQETYKIVTVSERLDLEGILRKHNEVYIIGADTLSDVEHRATEQLLPLCDGKFRVISAAPISFARDILEVEDPAGEVETDFFAVTVEYKIAETGEDPNKTYKDKYLVSAVSISEAEKAVESYFSGDDSYNISITAANKLGYAGLLNLGQRTAIKGKKGWVMKEISLASATKEEMKKADMVSEDLAEAVDVVEKSVKLKKVKDEA